EDESLEGLSCRLRSARDDASKQTDPGAGQEGDHCPARLATSAWKAKRAASAAGWFAPDLLNHACVDLFKVSREAGGVHQERLPHPILKRAAQLNPRRLVRCQLDGDANIILLVARHVLRQAEVSQDARAHPRAVAGARERHHG